VNSQRLTRLALPVFLAVFALAAFSSDRTARAEDPIETRVQVVSGGTNPIIECKWELPDMISGLDGPSFPDDEIDYAGAGAAGLHIHDDDMAVSPGPPVPCDLRRDANGNAIGPPVMANNVHRMIQVMPNPADQPEMRKIQLWMAVDTQGATPAIFWKVYEKNPVGQYVLKVQVDVEPPATPPDPGTGQIADIDCRDTPTPSRLGNAVADRTMFHAAVHTGQLTADAVDHPVYGMKAKCSQDEKQLYFGRFDLSKHQPCGEYMIEAHAGNTVLVNFIDIVCIFTLDVDVTSINCGVVAPLTHPTCSGDDVFGSGATTIMNFGNHGMGLDVDVDPMCEWDTTQNQCVPGGPSIVDFDAKFGKAYSGQTAADNIQVIDPLCVAGPPPTGCADQIFSFDNDIRRVLCTNEHGKFDLSLHVPNIKPAVYRGLVTFIGRAVHTPQITGRDPGDLSCVEDQEAHSAIGG
jgi:hypothetical protein